MPALSWGRNRTRPVSISYTAPTIFIRPSATLACPSGESRIWRTVHRTLLSTARDNRSSGDSVGSNSGRPGRMLARSSWTRERNCSPSCLVASAAATAPHPSCPRTTNNGVCRYDPAYCRRPRDLGREDVAGHADHEQFSQAGIENPLGRHPRIAAPEDGRVGSLGPGEVGQRLSPEGGTARLAPEEPSIPLDQPRERFIGGDSVVFGSRSHHATPSSPGHPNGSSPPLRRHFS